MAESPGGIQWDTIARSMYKWCSDVCCIAIILLTLNSQISIQLAAARVQTLISHSFNPWTVTLEKENDLHLDDKLCLLLLVALVSASTATLSMVIRKKERWSTKGKTFF